MKALNEFYEFMRERESIRLRRLMGMPQDTWTQDPILKVYKFTNVKRKHDRTTRLLYEEFYNNAEFIANWTKAEVLFNCAVFRYFGTIEMARALGWTRLSTDFNEFKARLIATAVERFKNKLTVFTGAYIIPNCGDSRPKHEVVADTLGEIHALCPKAVSTESWNHLCDVLKRANGVGSFMAKEVALDYILATKWIPTDWTTYTPIGPGARRGAARVLSGGVLESPGGLPESRAFEVCKALWAERDAHWPKHVDIMFSPGTTQQIQTLDADGNIVQDLRGVEGMRHESESLDLTDIQFQLCEFDKYMRAKLGEGRPKKKFSPSHD